MRICAIFSPNFKRKLKPSEENDYSRILTEAKAKAAHCKEGESRSLLIIPASAMPQEVQNNTGVGNLASAESDKFFNFAKKYWGINEIQLLPIGQYHSHSGGFPIYSGTSANLGNHIINLKDFLPENDFKDIVSRNQDTNKVNFSNIVEFDSISEVMLKKLYKNMPNDLKIEFEEYKNVQHELLERKSLYNTLLNVNNSYDYKKWNHIDKHLFNNDIINETVREKRIAEIKQKHGELIDFYKFKNFLADKSLKKAKDNLNSKGIKLNGDMLCNFSFDEVWSYPKAFLKNKKLARWNIPVLDRNSPDAELILRKKTNFYAKRFDGFRIDAAWTYISPNIIDTKTLEESKLLNGEYFLNIIDDEVKKIKGKDFNLNNITHEFAADAKKDYNIYAPNNTLKPSVKNRVKIYTSEHMSEHWGNAVNFIERGWGDDKFIIGAVNHDSKIIEPKEEQIKALSKLLNIPKEKLRTTNEFIKAKFAEPLRAKNNMLFFLPALGIHKTIQHYDDKTLNWTAKIPNNYEAVYFNALNNGSAYNPMDALEKQFIAQGLDKEHPALFKKIVKYRKILQQKENAAPKLKILISAAIAVIGLTGIFMIVHFKKDKLSHSSSKYSL